MVPPKVSVVIPTKGRPTLKRTIASILEQTVQDFEVLAIVGTRRDISREAVGSATDPRVRVLRPPFERFPDYLPARVATLRNYGIDIAKGAYIAYLDDDNWWAPSHLEKLCEILDGDPSIGFAHSWRRLVNADGSPHPLHTYPWRTRFENQDEIFQKLVAYDMADPGEAVIRDKLVAEGGDECFHIDPSELLVRGSIHERFRFPTSFTLRQIIRGADEDSLLCEALYRAGVRWGCSRAYTVYYCMGGYSNED